MNHHCHARGCSTPCKPERLMCKRHWAMVPKELQKAVWDTYRPGQCDDKNPSREWHEAADAAILTVWEKEQKRSGRAIQHSAKSVEHYGPDYIGGMIRATFDGPINLDPASCTQANLLIGAERYYTEKDNGLILPWFGNVYNNPPGGRIRYLARTGELGKGLLVNGAALWYATLVHRFTLGHVSQAIFMIFNLELFRYAQDYQVRQPQTFPICFPKARLDFWKPGPVRRFLDIDGQGTPGELAIPVPQGSPAHPSALVYMGPNPDRFRDVFIPASGDWPGGQVHNV
jgi:hypothetical protein